MTRLHGFGGVLNSLWMLSFGLSQVHGHGSWLVALGGLGQPSAMYNKILVLFTTLPGKTSRSLEQLLHNKSLGQATKATPAPLGL